MILWIFVVLILLEANRGNYITSLMLHLFICYCYYIILSVLCYKA